MKTIKFIFSLLVSLMLVVPSWAQDTPTDGYVYAKDIAGSLGKTIELPIVLKNTQYPVNSLQFDIELPEGATFVTDQHGEHIITPVDEELNSKWILTTKSVAGASSRTTRAVLYNADYNIKEFTPLSTGERVLLTIKVQIAEDADLVTDARIKISEETITNRVSGIDDATHPLQSGGTLSSNLKTFKLGDVNRNGEVDVTDLVALLSVINGQTENLDLDAANANEDNAINITDRVAIMEIINNNKTK